MDKAKELEMWQQWKSSGEDPQYLRPLQKSMQNMIRHKVNQYAYGSNIPVSMLENESNQNFVRALRTYDPQKAALSTHVMTNLKRLDRYVKSYQNVGRIQEKRARRFGQYKKAKAELQQELGRLPTAMELAQKLSIEFKEPVTPAEASRFMKEDRRDVLESGSAEDAFVRLPTSSRMVLKALPEELTPEENAVFERLFGMNGQRQMRAGDIARELGMHPSKVSRIRNSIENKLTEYLH